MMRPQFINATLDGLRAALQSITDPRLRKLGTSIQKSLPFLFIICSIGYLWAKLAQCSYQSASLPYSRAEAYQHSNDPRSVLACIHYIPTSSLDSPYHCIDTRE